MRIDPPTPGPFSLRASGHVRAASTWAVGQLVELHVLEQVDARTVKLEIGGQTLLARTELNLAPGTVLKATVTTGGTQPQLSVLEPNAAPTPQASITAALGRALPRQAPLTETFPALLSVLGEPAAADALPREVKAGLEELLARMPDATSLGRPGSLAKALEDAGNSLESRLAQTVQEADGAPPAADRKWQLLALRQSIVAALARLPPAPQAEPESVPAAATVPGQRPGPPSALPGREPSEQLLGKPSRQEQALALSRPVASNADSRTAPNLDGPSGPTDTTAREDQSPSARGVLQGLLHYIDTSLARLGTHQFQTAASALQQHAFGFFELPLRHDLGRESALLEFEADRSGTSAAQEAPLVVRLELPLGDLGVFRAQITMQGERVAVSTWSDSPELRQMITSRLAELDSALQAHGFALLPTTLRKTQPPEALRHGTLPLVDTRA